MPVAVLLACGAIASHAQVATILFSSIRQPECAQPAILWVWDKLDPLCEPRAVNHPKNSGFETVTYAASAMWRPVDMLCMNRLGLVALQPAQKVNAKEMSFG